MNIIITQIILQKKNIICDSSSKLSSITQEL